MNNFLQKIFCFYDVISPDETIIPLIETRSFHSKNFLILLVTEITKRWKRMQLTICVGSCCYSKGAQEIIDFVKFKYPEIEIQGAFCLGNCSQGVSINYNGKISQVKNTKDIEKLIKELK